MNNKDRIKESLSRLIQAPKQDPEKRETTEFPIFPGLTLTTPKGEKGDKGDTPEKFKDYFTAEEQRHFLALATPVKGEQYFHQNDINDFLKASTPVKGVHYNDGKDGRDGVDGKDGIGIDGRNGVDGKDGADGKNPDPRDVIEKIKSLKGNDRLDISALRNGERLAQLVTSTGKKLAEIDQRWHGGGITNVSSNGVLVTSSGTSLNFTGSGASNIATDNLGNITVSLSDVFGFSPYSLNSFRLAVAKTRAGVKDTKILCLGDSVTLGYDGVSNPTTVYTSYPWFLAEMMAAHVPAAPGLGMLQYNGVALGNLDARWTLGTGWASNSAAYGFGSETGIIATSPSGSLTFTPGGGYTYDTFDVYYVLNASYGSIGITATGGSTTNVTLSTGGNVVGVSTVTAGSASTSNAVSITATGTAQILAIEPSLSSQTKVRIGMAGLSGAATSNFISNTNPQSALGTQAAYAADLTIINLGANDASASVSAATLYANLSAIISEALLSGDVILQTMPPSNKAPYTAYEPSYQAVYLALSRAFKVPIVDIWSRFGGVFQPNYMYVDGTFNVHPNVEGYWDIATAFEVFLDSVVGGDTGTASGSSGALAVGTTLVSGAVNGYVLYNNNGVLGAESVSGTGTVTTVSVASANGISGTVANPTTTPAITLTLGSITPTVVTASQNSGTDEAFMTGVIGVAFFGSLTNSDVHFQTNNADRMFIAKSTGRVNIGPTIGSAAALLGLAAGTTTQAPLNVASGTNMTSPADGSLEYNGTHLYFTVGTTRYQLDQQSGGSSAWSGLTSPTGNLALSMGSDTTTFTWGASTGSAVNLFNLIDTTSNTGTGYLVNINTATGSNLKPLNVSAKGSSVLSIDASSNITVQGSTLTVTPNPVFNNGITLVTGLSSPFTTGLQSSGSLPASYTMTLPAGPGSAGQTFYTLDGAATLAIGILPVAGGGTPFNFDTNTPQGTPLNSVYRLRHSFNNFLSNASFEYWQSGTSVAPTGWTENGGVTVAQSSTATTGSFSAQLTYDASNTGEFYQGIGISTLVDYTFSCYVQRTSGTGTARLVAQENSTPFTEFASVALPTASGWQLVTLTVKPSAGTSMRFSVKSGSAAASVWLVDECMFQESKGIATAFLPAYLDDTTPGMNIFGVPNFINGISTGQTGTTLGNLKLLGNTSGTVTVQPAAAAGTWTMTLPTTAGTNTYVLQTDGTGNTSWVATSGSSYTFSTGLTNSSGTVTSNLLTGVSGGQTAIGGTGVTDKLVLQGTTANGTATSAAINFNVGNAGATTAMSILNNGNVLVGTTVFSEAANALTIATASNGGITLNSGTGALTMTMSSLRANTSYTPVNGSNYIRLDPVLTGTFSSGSMQVAEVIPTASGLTNTATIIGFNVNMAAITGGNVYSALFQNGNVGIGVAAPAALLSVGTSSAFQVNASGTVTTPLVNNVTSALGTTITTGTLHQNTTAAASGAQQYSPAIVLEGQGWQTGGTPATKAVDWAIVNIPVQGTTVTGQLMVTWAIAGGAYTTTQAAIFNTNPGISVPVIGMGGTNDPYTGIGGGNGSGQLSMVVNSTTATWWSSSGAKMYHVNTLVMAWTPGAPVGGTPDVGITRNGVGILEINSGTAGTFRDLKMRQMLTYQSVTTAGWGVPAIYGSGRVTAQTAANASIATYTVGASDGTFLVSANVAVTASTTHAFTATCTYTDETNTSRVLTLSFSQLTGTFLTSITNVQGVGAYEGIPLHIRCKASTSITIATAAGGTYTSVTYNAEGLITQMA